MSIAGGIGSVAAVQNQMADLTLANYNLPLAVSLVSTQQDWANRQRLNYAAMVSLIAADFLSLTDWAEQISMYSHANFTQLSSPLGTVANRLLQNHLFRATLLPDPQLGISVGQFLLLLPQFSDAVSAPQELLTNSADLSAALGVD